MGNEEIANALMIIVSRLEDIQKELSDIRDNSLNKFLSEEEFVMKYAPEIYVNIEDINAKDAVLYAVDLHKEIQAYKKQGGKESK